MIPATNQNNFGLDISGRALRCVYLKKEGKKITVNSFGEIRLANGIIENGEIKKPDLLAKEIEKLLRLANGGRIATKDVIAVLPEPKTFVKVMTTANVQTEISELVKEEIKNHIPFSPDEIYLDWQVIYQNQKTIKLLVGAAPKDIVDSYTSALEKSGLTPQSLEIEALAITRSLVPEEDIKPKIIIDFGAIRTGLIVYDQQAVQFTVSLPISGRKITETISQSLKLEWMKAEKAKIICGLDKTKCEGALLKILMGAINQLTTHIKKAIIFYQTNFSGANPIAEIIICGGGANFSQIDKVLAEKLNLPVRIGNPLTKITPSKKISIPDNKILSYTTAIGLALGNWIKPQKIKKHKIDKKK